MQTKLLYLLWFLALFHPFRLLNSFSGGLSILFKIQTVLLYAMTLVWLLSGKKKTNYPVLLGIVILHVFGTLFIAYNTGYAREVTRIIFEAYLLGLITFSFFRAREHVDKLFTMFAYSFLFFAIFGIMGKGLVRWDYGLSDENQFGVFMGMGVFFCLYYAMGQPQGKRRLIGLITSALCLVGVIVSFSRGAFLGVFACLGILWLQSKKKILATGFTILAFFITVTASSVFFPDNAFWTEMKSIGQGTAQSTALDRVVLWGIALEEFKDNPLFGVGPHNFGIRARDYATEKALVRYPDFRTLWGRSLHNIYFQTLAEQGIVGVVLFIILLVGFFRRNKEVRQALQEPGSMKPDKKTLQPMSNTTFAFYSKALYFGMLCFLVGGFFYPLYELDWLWHMLIFNMVLYLVIVKEGLPQDANKA